MIRLPCVALVAVGTLLVAPAAAVAQRNGASNGQPDPRSPRGVSRDGVKGSQGAEESVGPVSSSAENKGSSPVGSPNPLAGSTFGKR